MNSQDALRDLAAQLQNFIVHEQCIKEFSLLLKKELSGKADVFLAVLTTQLKHLADLGPLITKIDDHEKLKYNTLIDIYSIHLKRSQFNIRLLVSFDKMSNACLLTVFYERSGKKATDYSAKIRIANERFMELQRKIKDEQ